MERVARSDPKVPTPPPTSVVRDPAGHEPAPADALPALSAMERQVLDVLSRQGGRRLTAGQIAGQIGCTREDLKSALDALRVKGLVACLNTIVESYSCRFPGLDLEGVTDPCP